MKEIDNKKKEIDNICEVFTYLRMSGKASRGKMIKGITIQE